MLDKLRQAYKALTYSQGFFGASAPSSQAPNAQCSLARSPPHAAVSRTETADIHHVKGYKMLPAEPFPDPDYEQQGCSVAELAAASLSPVEGARVIPSLGKLHPRLAAAGLCSWRFLPWGCQAAPGFLLSSPPEGFLGSGQDSTCARAA